MRIGIALWCAVVAAAVEAPTTVPVGSVVVLQSRQPTQITCAGRTSPTFPTRTGHQLRLVFRTPGPVPWTADDGTSGTITVTPSAEPGPIRLVGGRLAFPDGRPFLPLGPNIAWMEGADPRPGFARDFALLAAQGGTHVRIWLCSWSLGLGDPVDLERAEQVDAVLVLARQHGLRVTLVLENHTDLLRTPGWAARAVPDRLGYAVSRWASDDTVLAWELGNELDLAEPDPARLDDWLMRAAAEVRARDPERRPVIASWHGPGWRTSRVDLDWFGVHPYVHEFTDAPLDYRLPSRDALAEFIGFAQQERRWWAMEAGFQGTAENNPGNDRDEQGLLFSQQLWAGHLLGLAPAMAWWWDSHVAARNLWPRYQALARITGTLDASLVMVPLVPEGDSGPLRILGQVHERQALVWPHPRDDTWYAALVEGRPRLGLSRRQVVRLGGFRPEATLRWTRWDQETGREREQSVVKTSAEGRVDLVMEPGVIDEVWTLTGPGTK